MNILMCANVIVWSEVTYHQAPPLLVIKLWGGIGEWAWARKVDSSWANAGMLAQVLDLNNYQLSNIENY